MRALTDGEDTQLRTKYPGIWMSTQRRPEVVAEDPLTLRLFVARDNMIVPVDVKGFEIELDSEDSPTSPSLPS